MAPGVFLWFSTTLPENDQTKKTSNNDIESTNNNEKTVKPSPHVRWTHQQTTTGRRNTIAPPTETETPRVALTSPPKVERRRLHDIPECLFIVQHSDDEDCYNSESNSNTNSSQQSPQVGAVPDDENDETMLEVLGNDNLSIYNNTTDTTGGDDDGDDFNDTAADQEQVHYFDTPSPTSEDVDDPLDCLVYDENDFDDEDDAFDESTAQQSKEKFDSGVRSPRRVRINSRDIPRTYSGLYGQDEDLLPFECQRQQRGTITSQSIWFLLLFYVTVVAGVQLAVSPSLLLNHHEDWVWTATNAIHLAVTVPYIHWLKGSIFDPQGEMNALTIWEQLEARGSDSKHVRQLLLIAPTILCYAACHFASYRVGICAVNLVCWIIALLGKLPFMNGVRIFGINRTVGIDDDDAEEDAVPSAEKKKEL